MQSENRDRSFGELLSTLTKHTSVLCRQEIALAKVEAQESLSEAIAGFVSIAVGGMIALAALMVLLQALTVALANFMAPSLAALCVGGGTALIAFLLVQKGLRHLKAKNLMPERTVRSLQQTTEMVKDHAR